MRCEQFKLLEELLREARMINHGSSAINRIERAIEIAEKLNEDDMSGNADSSSFLYFLRQQIIASRFPAEDAK